MHKYLKTLFNICLLREGPEKLPHSYVLLGLVAAISFSVSVYIGSIDYSVSFAGLTSIAILFFSFLFTKLLLLKKPERFLQTFSAMLGADAIITTMSIPSFYSLTYLKLGEIAQIFFSLTIFALFIWAVIVYGYIFSKALSSQMGFGLALSVSYALLGNFIFSLFLAGNTST